MIKLDILSRSRTKNLTPTPSLVRNPTPTPPKNIRLLKTPTPQPWLRREQILLRGKWSKRHSETKQERTPVARGIMT